MHLPAAMPPCVPPGSVVLVSKCSDAAVHMYRHGPSPFQILSLQRLHKPGLHILGERLINDSHLKGTSHDNFDKHV